MRWNVIISILFAFLILVSAPGYADLINRGNGLIYDTVLNITWLQDANLAATNTFGITGWNANRNSWDATQDWIAAMNAANYLGVSTWRLPKILPVNGNSYNFYYYPGTGIITNGYDGSYDIGYNVGAPGSAYAYSAGSEMAYMYYVNLGNTGYYDTSGIGPQAGFNPAANSSMINASGETIAFLNLKADFYWSETDYLLPVTSSSGTVYPGQDFAWFFHFAAGGQNIAIKDVSVPGIDYYPRYAWPVLDGDVAAVPEPSTLALLGIGLSAIGFTAWRRKK
jgi:hypothetical protein